MWTSPNPPRLLSWLRRQAPFHPPKHHRGYESPIPIITERNKIKEDLFSPPQLLLQQLPLLTRALLSWTLQPLPPLLLPPSSLPASNKYRILLQLHSRLLVRKNRRQGHPRFYENTFKAWALQPLQGNHNNSDCFQREPSVSLQRVNGKRFKKAIKILVWPLAELDMMERNILPPKNFSSLQHHLAIKG